MLEYRWFVQEVWSRRTRGWFLASENERLTVFVCYHHAVRKVWTVLDAWKKSRFGAVTFDKRVALFMFKYLSELKSGKECDGLHSLAELIFDGMIVVYFLLFTLKHFGFFPLRRHEWLVDDCFGCHSKVFSASSVELASSTFQVQRTKFHCLYHKDKR